MRYFGFLLSIPVAVFASFEDRELSAKEQTAYRIEEKEMFARNENLHDQIAKMFASYEMDEEDSFSLFEEDSDSSSNSYIGDEVTHLDENAQSDLYEEEDYAAFSPTQESVPQRSRLVETQPKIARQNKKGVVARKQGLKPKQQEITLDSLYSEEEVEAPLSPKKGQKIQKKQPQQAVVIGESEMVQQPQRKAPAAKAPVKKKVAPSGRSPVVQNRQKTASAPSHVKKKEATAPKNGAIAQRKSNSLRKGAIQRRNPNAAARRPAVEMEAEEE